MINREFLGKYKFIKNPRHSDFVLGDIIYLYRNIPDDYSDMALYTIKKEINLENRFSRSEDFNSKIMEYIISIEDDREIKINKLLDE